MAPHALDSLVVGLGSYQQEESEEGLHGTHDGGNAHAGDIRDVLAQEVYRTPRDIAAKLLPDISTLDAVCKFAADNENAERPQKVERTCFVRGIANAARESGFETAIDRLVPLILQLLGDHDAAIRVALAEQLAPLAEFFAAQGDGYSEVLGLLQVTAELLADDDDEVVDAAEAALAGVARHLRPSDLESDVGSVVDVLVDHQDEEKRMAAARVVARLCVPPSPIFDANQAAKTAVPSLEVLSKDEAFRVRKCVALAIPAVAEAVGQVHAGGVLAPLFAKLAQDEFWAVRQATATALPHVAMSLPDSTRAAALSPLAEALLRDENVGVASSARMSLGTLLAQIGVEAPETLLISYAKMSEGGGEGAPTTSSDLQLACAESFAGVVGSMGISQWHMLRESHARLCASVQWKVRRACARSLGAVAAHIGEAQADECVCPVLETMLADVAEVKHAAMASFADVLSALSPARAVDMLAAHLHGLAVAPLAPTEACANWRARASLASRLGVLAGVAARPGLTAERARDVVRHSVLPASLALVTDPVAAVRDAATTASGDWANALAVFDAQSAQENAGGLASTRRPAQLKGLPKGSYGGGAFEHGGDEHADDSAGGSSNGMLMTAIRALQEFATSSSYLRRLTYVAACASMVRAGGAAGHAVRESMHPLLLTLADDPVANVRLMLAHALARSDELMPDMRYVLGVLASDADRGVREEARRAMAITTM